MATTGARGRLRTDPESRFPDVSTAQVASDPPAARRDEERPGHTNGASDREGRAIFDYQQLFHVGVRVPVLEDAMESLGQGLGVTWAAVQEREQKVWLPDKGPASIQLRFTYSAEGPQHIELLQGEAGTLWDGNDLPGVHHMGVWVDDVKAVTDHLLATGWTLEIAQLPPEDGYGAFTYARSPQGFLLEPVWSGLKPMFERWWAGGSLG